MPKHVIKSDRSTQWVVNKDGHTWIIEKQAELLLDPGPAILIEDGFDRNKFFIDGDVRAIGAMASEGTSIRNNGDRNTFTLGDKALIEAFQGIAGTGDHTKVVNHGTIMTSVVGIAQNEDFTLTNHGYLYGGDYGVSVAQARLITNGRDGTIMGPEAGILLFGDGTSTIVNKGNILGAVQGAIKDGDGSVKITNTGTITGDLDLGGGGDILNSIKGVVDGKVTGGDGSDIYRISQSDLLIVEELDEGNDAVYSTVDFTLWSNIEGLVLKGKRNIDGAGNASDNEIVGNKGNNQLYGVGGEDVMIGNGGNDTLTGGADGDSFLFGKGFGKDIITDFVAGLDTIAFIGINGLHDVDDVMSRLEQHGQDVWIATSSGKLILKDIDVGILDDSDFGVLHS